MQILAFHQRSVREEPKQSYVQGTERSVFESATALMRFAFKQRPTSRRSLVQIGATRVIDVGICHQSLTLFYVYENRGTRWASCNEFNDMTFSAAHKFLAN